MCGIVAAVAERNVTPILLDGLKRLEYRGYDSAGLALVTADGTLQLARALGKVAELEKKTQTTPHRGMIGVAHTRWATHGVPAERNSHPHISHDIAVVHNGIIENHAELKAELLADGVEFQSETDTEVVTHLLQQYCVKNNADLRAAFWAVLPRLHGAYALAVMHKREPDHLFLARKGSPLAIGVGLGEHFAASDATALLSVTNRFIYLAEGDVAEISREQVKIWDVHGNIMNNIQRPTQTSQLSASSVDKGEYRHFMLKEIYEQPQAVANTLEGRIANGKVLEAMLGPKAGELLDQIARVQIIACGTSANAGMVSRYWFEKIAKIPCAVELASEFRYRTPVIEPNTLFITISQSGETADTLEALRYAKSYLVNDQSPLAATLAICNAPESSLVRESDIVLMTHAGPERSVASTKAFTTQLAALAMVMILLGRRRGLSENLEAELVHDLECLPGRIESALQQNKILEKLAEKFTHKQHALFLGRGALYPVASEGALKLKEISYIHAESYAAGELKHGPLALVDEEMPIVAVAPNGDLLEKLKSNLQEVSARGGELFVFADQDAGLASSERLTVINMPHAAELIAPMVYTIPLQLLSYHVAVIRGTDVDQPRNLAKSVTVE